MTTEVAQEFRFFRVYKDGRVELFRPSCDKIPPENDPVTGVQSKDVTISTEPTVSARIFLPKLENPSQKLPVLVYTHGGGFCMQSAFSPQHHNFTSAVAAEGEAIVVSVEYGLFPARPVPACYEDSWEALQWVASHVNKGGPEPWLNDHGDFGRIFIGGNSAGGNIAHTLAFWVGSLGLPAGVKVVGLIMVQPFLGGTEDDQMWLFMCPSNRGLEDPRLNPPAEDLARIGCERALIFVSENDHLNAPAKSYYERLHKSGWKGQAELVENRNVGHTFHIFYPNHEEAVELRHKFALFIKKE